MAKGHPDYQTWLGKAAGGGELRYDIASLIIASETNTSSLIAVVPAGFEYIFLSCVVSSNNDSGIHNIDIIENISSAIFYSIAFTDKAVVDLAGMIFKAGEQLKTTVYNNADAQAGFYYTITYIKRKLS